MKFKKQSGKKTKAKKRKVSKKKYLVRKYTNILGNILKTLLTLGLVGAAFYFLLYSPLFKIEKIIIEGTKKFVNPQDVLLIAESNAKSVNIFKFKKEELSEKLEKNLLGAKRFEIKKEFPNKIRILINERTPAAIIYQDKDDYYLIDNDGYVLGYTDPNNVDFPKIKYEKDIKVGLFIDKNLVPIYLELTELFLKEDIDVSSMSFSPKHVNLFLDNDITVLIGNEKNKQEALKAVKSLIQESGADDRQIRRIDFRYDKVIVLFK